jgi:hypothetical protein
MEVLFLFLFFFETVSYCVAQASLELAILLQPSTARITGCATMPGWILVDFNALNVFILRAV